MNTENALTGDVDVPEANTATPTAGKTQDPTRFRYDDKSLERNSLHYPEELKKAFLWLGWYVREKCDRNVATLTDRARELGINVDTTNWAKLFRGQWNRDRQGNPTQAPIISLKKLLRYIEQLQDANRMEESAGKIPFVVTSTAQDIFNFIDDKRQVDRVNKFGIIVGATGTQKTACLKEYWHRNNSGMTVWMEMPENGSLSEFMVQLAMKYGSPRTTPYVKARNIVMETVNRKRTIIIDNAQAAYKENKGAKQPVFDFLRRLQDEKGCTVILSITPEFDAALTTKMVQGYFEQFEGRAGGRSGFLRLPKYPPEEDVIAIAEAFGLQNAERHVDYLKKQLTDVPGRVRILFETLQAAKKMAQADRKALTLDYVKEAAGEEVE